MHKNLEVTINSMKTPIMGPLAPSELKTGTTYKVRTQDGIHLAQIHGPMRDQNGVEFYIIENEGGDEYDVEYKGRGMWDAGHYYGKITIYNL